MISFVISLNLLIAAGCLWLAWQIWYLRRKLARVTTVLDAVERRTHKILAPAPAEIAKGQAGSNDLRHRYQRLITQLQQLQKIVQFLGWGQRIYQRQRRQFVRTKLYKK